MTYRSADFQSAVSRNCIPPASETRLSLVDLIVQRIINRRHSKRGVPASKSDAGQTAEAAMAAELAFVNGLCILRASAVDYTFEESSRFGTLARDTVRLKICATTVKSAV